ncbi:MAG: hypothetical protein RMI74_07455 [Thermodesulfobacterium sp.]|nr:hypothetical protein [Thermodesulfobacterium sp.]
MERVKKRRRKRRYEGKMGKTLGELVQIDSWDASKFWTTIQPPFLDTSYQIPLYPNIPLSIV